MRARIALRTGPPIWGILTILGICQSPAHAERLIGFSIVDQVIFKLDTKTGELIKFFGHPVFNLGGIDIDSQGNIYYLDSNATVWKIDLLQPSNDEYIGSTPKVTFESFEIVNDVGYSGGVFNGTFYEISLTTGQATPIGQYGGGGGDRITGLASTDYPGSAEPLRLFGQRVFLDDIIEVDPRTGANLGVVISDPALGVTNLAYGGGQSFWFINGADDTLYRLDLQSDGSAAVPVLTGLEIGADGLTLVDPEPFIATDSLPDGVLNEPYGPMQLEYGGGGPGIQWVALSEGYEEINLGENLFQLVGVDQGLTGDDVAMPYALPFAFPYYGKSYLNVWICNNGFIDFQGPFTDPNNSDASLIAARRICPLWDNLRTDFGGRDVRIDESVPGEVTIRWDALENADMGVCNFSCTLFQSGVIEFHYGLPNNTITPTVGISNGDGEQFIISQYSGMKSLHTADSLRYQVGGGLPEGIVLSSDGVLSGTPLETGMFQTTVQLTDALGGFDERQYTLEVHEISQCPADLTGDKNVGPADLAIILGNWGPVPPNDPLADLNGDGVVGPADLAIVLGNWGPCP